MSLIHQVLAQYWGYTEFRPSQEDIIRSVMEKNDTLALLPTGGGKSICFQVPAMANEGLCLVISPLIALMKDQEENLRNKGIRAVAIVSGMKRSEVDIALDNCIYGNYKFLYVSPERLESDFFLERLIQMKLNLIAVDEAHCISQWGYDFRPPYRRIAEIRESFPEVPIIALTASATPEVKEDICKQLKFKNHQVFTKSFARPNLSYVVRHEDKKMESVLKILKSIPGCGIIYVRNRRKTQDIANQLIKNGIRADYYHAGLSQTQRMEKQSKWMKNNSRIIVSTNAFGMGIDKSDVRSVIHLDLPDNLESYYQEAGRCGRDEKSSYAVVLYNQSDILDLERRIKVNFPELDEIRKVYQALGNYLQIPINGGLGLTLEFDLVSFCDQYRFDPVKTYNCLKVLELEEHLTLSDSIYLPSRLFIPIKNIELYEFQVKHTNYDHLIKTILRSYTGLFDNYIRFNEVELANRSGIEIKTLKQELETLNKLGVLNYLPSTELPQLTFNEARVETKMLRISKANLDDRKQRFTIRANAFKQFITDKYHCRSMLLLAYFGENNLNRCGTCDYCRDRNKLELNDIEMEDLKNEIQLLLNIGPELPQVIASKIKGYKEEKIITVLRWLIDIGDVKTDALGRIYYNKN